jgi:hypothetical protein
MHSAAIFAIAGIVGGFKIIYCKKQGDDCGNTGAYRTEDALRIRFFIAILLAGLLWLSLQCMDYLQAFSLLLFPLVEKISSKTRRSSSYSFPY